MAGEKEIKAISSSKFKLKMSLAIHTQVWVLFSVLANICTKSRFLFDTQEVLI